MCRRPFEFQQEYGVIPHAARAIGSRLDLQDAAGRRQLSAAMAQGPPLATPEQEPALALSDGAQRGAGPEELPPGHFVERVRGVLPHVELVEDHGVQTRVHANRRRAVKSPRSSVQAREFMKRLIGDASDELRELTHEKGKVWSAF